MNPSFETPDTPPVQITVLIVVHNRLALTQRCIAALRSGTQNTSLKYVVVDDGSTDGTAEWLASQPDVVTIKGSGNLWFGGATDLGFRHILPQDSGCTHLLILNNDTFIKPGAIASMLAAVAGDDNTVAAAAYWTEDSREANSAGYRWKPWRGLRDICFSADWIRENRSGRGLFLPVDGVATTLVLIPMPLLRRTTLPDPQLHPHNRYDAVLSARMRKAGARLMCSTELLAYHLYGPVNLRPTVRKIGLKEFLSEVFSNRRSIWHLAGGFAQAWEVAPNRIQACWALALIVGLFFRQLAWVSLNSLRMPRSQTRTATS